ncbi:MAG TPA: sugar ABC transporter permease [Nitrososphaeraceae archaeon]|nr:sugar ABC transporter permease [Nitrososphaeraceae archaeon]
MPSNRAIIEPYLYLLPSLLILVVFLLFPLVWNIYVSVHNVSILTILKDWEFVGLKNFIDLLTEPKFYESLKLTLFFAGGSVLAQFTIGLVLSILLNQKIQGTNIFRMLLIIPWSVSTVITAFSFKFMYDDNFGILNYLLKQMGLDSVGWLSDPNIAIWSIVLTNIWYGTPFTILFLTAGLQSINPLLYEAALIDGATKIKRFFFITIPLLRQFMVTNLILITVWSINFFDLQLIMTGGGPLFSTTTISLYMYRQAFEFGSFSGGATIGIFLIIMNLLLTLTYIKIFNRRSKL